MCLANDSLPLLFEFVPIGGSATTSISRKSSPCTDRGRLLVLAVRSNRGQPTGMSAPDITFHWPVNKYHKSPAFQRHGASAATKLHRIIRNIQTATAQHSKYWSISSYFHRFNEPKAKRQNERENYSVGIGNRRGNCYSRDARSFMLVMLSLQWYNIFLN